jgi:hypothetical protein
LRYSLRLDDFLRSFLLNKSRWLLSLLRKRVLNHLCVRLIQNIVAMGSRVSQRREVVESYGLRGRRTCRGRLVEWLAIVFMELLEPDSRRRAGICEFAYSVENLQQLGFDGFVVCRRSSAADDIVVMTFGFLGKLLLVVAVKESVCLERDGEGTLRLPTLFHLNREPWCWDTSILHFERVGV